jgi:hypothetical protein
MSEDRPDTRCAVCATTEGPFHRHHLALRANDDAATVMLCIRHHNEQTARQRNAGLITREPTKGGDGLRTLHALVEGLAGVLSANAGVLGDRQLACAGEQDRRFTLRLLGLICDERPGQLGPRPISNDRRNEVRAPDIRGGDTPSPAAALQALAPVLTALANAIDSLLADEVTQALVHEHALGLATAGGQLAADRELCVALAALDDHPRAGELSALIGESRLLFHKLIKKTDALVQAGDDARPDSQFTEMARAFMDATQRSLGFWQALGAGNDPTVALNRLLDEHERTRSQPTPAQERGT